MTALFLAKPGFTFSDDSEGLAAILRSFDCVYTLRRSEALCSMQGIRTEVLEVPGPSYVQQIEQAVHLGCSKGVSIIVTAGGDGIASYAASAAASENPRPVILGYPAGTENAGPIVRNIAGSSLESFVEKDLDAIEVMDGEDVIGYGFNDVVLADTFLGTLEGKLVNLSARDMVLEGKATVARPGERITGPSFHAELNGEDRTPKQEIRQICISALQNDRICQRAVFGGLLDSTGFSHPAAASFIDRNVIDSNPKTWNTRQLSRTSSICFNEEDILVLTGLGPDAQIIIDGNPFIRKTDRISLRVVPGACTALWDSRWGTL